MKVGDWNVEVVPQGQVLRLRILGRPYGLETLAGEAEVLSLTHYLVREVEKLTTMKTKEDIP